MDKKEKPMYRFSTSVVRFLTSVVISLIIFGVLVLIFSRGIMHCVCAVKHVGFLPFFGLCFWSAIAAVSGIRLNQIIGRHISLGEGTILFSQWIGMGIHTAIWCVYSIFFSKQTLWTSPDYPRERDDFIMLYFCLFTLVITFWCSLILRIIQLYRDSKSLRSSSEDGDI